MPRGVELVPHDPTWALQAAEEIALITFALGSALIRVEHVGSTSIPGLRAKPIIDLLPIATSLEALDAREGAIRALGYEGRGEWGLPGRRYFVRNSDDGRRLFNVHCWPSGHPSLKPHLAFRDYLCAHTDEARAYEAVKLEAAAAHSDDALAYQQAKSGWIAACEARAMVWATR